MTLSVLHLDHTAEWGGGEIALVRLLDAVDPKTVTHTVACAAAGPLVDAVRARGIQAVVLPLADRVRGTSRSELARLARFAAAPTLLAYAVRVARLARSLRVDVIHTNSMKAHVYGLVAGRLARVPVVTYLRDDLGDIPSRPAAAAMRALLRHGPTRLVACSMFTLEGVGGAADPARVIYSGVPQADVLTGAQERKRPPVVGMIARIAPWKGQALFLEAAERVAVRHPDVRFRLVGAPLFGEEDYLERLGTIAGRPPLAGRVEFGGFVADPRSEFDGLAVSVAASLRPEPLGKVLIEAMARGVPVVAPREGGPAEIVTSGEDGLLVAPRDPEALAGAILRLLDDADAAHRLATRALETVRERFTVEANAARFTALLQEAAT